MLIYQVYIVGNPKDKSTKYGGMLGNKVLETHEYVQDHIVLNDPNNCPQILLLYAPCRSGTTAFLKTFSEAVPLSYYQPMKSIMRWSRPKFNIDTGPDPIFFKETFGAHRDGECVFNPIEFLLKAGVPKGKINTIPMLRHPLHTYDSWKRVFGGTSIEPFLKSYKNAWNVYQFSMDEGIKSSPFYYEELDENRVSSVKRIFRKNNLEYSENVIKWDPEHAIEDPSKEVVFVDDQEDDFNEIVEAKMKLTYFPGGTENIPDNEISIIEDVCLPIYEKFKKEVKKES